MGKIFFNEYKEYIILFNIMYLRNYKGKIVFIDENKYSNERNFYIDVWKIKYNKNIAKKTCINDILNYIDGEKMFV